MIRTVKIMTRHRVRPDHPSRVRLQSGLPVSERILVIAGIATPVLEGGNGPPIVLLHGPGEFAEGWLRVIPSLVTTHRVICPDLPGHGGSEVLDGDLSSGRMIDWLGELVGRTCATPPVVVGRVVGGAIAARFAIEHSDRLAHLVLVDTLGLAQFAPAPRFGLGMQRFFAQPSGATYDRFMDFCTYDLDRLRGALGDQWDAFQTYAVDLAGSPPVLAAAGWMMHEFGARIGEADLARITVPTSLVWGRHDLATPLWVAEAASAALGWRLHEIDDAGDDPALEQPEAFVAALRDALTLDRLAQSA